jgi:xanthine dehydrogenase YagR molybdenum-binding subunit
VVSAKTARSQIMGGIVMGIGMALTEETSYDVKTGLPVTANLADYHVPTNADIPPIEVYFVGEPDYAFNPIGAEEWEKLASREWPRRWQTRSITRRASEFVICRLRRIS